MNNLLTIILLTFNKLDHTKKCIENIYKYTENFNLVIVDNGSEENMIFFLQDLEKKNKEIIVHYNKENVGIIKGRNQGYEIGKKFKAELIFFLDSDQYVLKNWFESYLEFINKGYSVIGSISWRMREADFYPYKIVKNKNEEFSYISCGSMMIKNSVIEDIGLFDERYEKFYFEDPDFIFRAHRAGYKIGWNYNKVIEHEKHNLSLFGERKKYFMENWKKFQNKWKGYEIPKFKMG